jgi:cation:H+ antiporter
VAAIALFREQRPDFFVYDSNEVYHTSFYVYTVSMLAQDILILIGSFLVLWIGSGLVIKHVTVLAHHLRLPRMFVSFILLGLLTSLPEIALATSSVIRGEPEVAIGNLLGGIAVLFFCVIPLLAMFGNGIKLRDLLQGHKLLLLLVGLLLPSAFLFDKTLQFYELIMLFLAYGLISFLLINNGVKHIAHHKHSHHFSLGHVVHDLLMIVGASVAVFVASNIVVEKTLILATLLQVSPFLISLFGLSIGTNLPEFSLIFRAISMKRKDIALGDYLGSASANLLILGGVGIASTKATFTLPGIEKYACILLLGFAIFWYFARRKKDLSRNEGFVLLSLYISLFVWEILLKN